MTRGVFFIPQSIKIVCCSKDINADFSNVMGQMLCRSGKLLPGLRLTAAMEHQFPEWWTKGLHAQSAPCHKFWHHH